MARNSSEGGCGCLVFGLVFGLPLLVAVLGVALLALISPVTVPFLLAHDPAQFHHDQTRWLVALGASPVVAFLLVMLASQPMGRRRSLARSHRATRWRTAVLRRSPLRTLILLATVNITALVLLTAFGTAHGPDAAKQTFIILGGALAAVLVVMAGIRLWDHVFPPGQRVEPVTVQAVQTAARKADQTLRQVRADNQRVSRLAAIIEQKLQAAQRDIDFEVLRDLHHESRGCADGAYRHYRSAGDSLHFMSGMLARTKTTLTLRIRSARNPTTGRRERLDRQALHAAATSLAQTKQSLGTEVRRGLTLVRDLNANTSRLKHSIKDNCGARGRDWYDALEQRIAARRREERGTAA